MTLTIDTTVRDIAVNNPANVRVFESLGIDYCCGANKTLGAACEKAGVPVDHALALLTAGVPGGYPSRDWNQARASEVIAHIVHTHHEYVRGQVPYLDSLFVKVVARHAQAHPELIELQRTFSELGQDLLAHLSKEEVVLFPYIRALDRGERTRACFQSVSSPISVMRSEHEDAGALLERIRHLANNFVPPDGACPTYRALLYGLGEFEADLHQHVHLENNIVFPKAEALEKAH